MTLAPAGRYGEFCSGMGSLVLLGCVCGLEVPLFRWASLAGIEPIGGVFWLNLFGGVACLSFAACKGRFVVPKGAALRFFVLYGLMAGVATETLFFVVAGHIEAAFLSIVIVTEGLIGFAIAAACGVERATGRRLLGLSTGLVGVAAMIWERSVGMAGSDWAFLLLAFCIPLSFAFENVLIATRRPPAFEPVCVIGWIMLFAAIILTPFVLVFGQIVPTDRSGVSAIPLLILAIGAALSIVATFLLLALVRTHGSVFAGQSGYMTAVAGVVWSALLLGEDLTLRDWAAFAFVLIGVMAVGRATKDADDPAGLPNTVPTRFAPSLSSIER